MYELLPLRFLALGRGVEGAGGEEAGACRIVVRTLEDLAQLLGSEHNNPSSSSASDTTSVSFGPDRNRFHLAIRRVDSVAASPASPSDRVDSVAASRPSGHASTASPAQMGGLRCGVPAVRPRLHCVSPSDGSTPLRRPGRPATPPLRLHQEGCSMVAHSPSAWRRATSASHFS